VPFALQVSIMSPAAVRAASVSARGWTRATLRLPCACRGAAAHARAARAAQVLKYAALSANISTEEPIDMVMHDSYPGKDTLWQSYTLKKFVPFNPVDKFTMAIVQENATGKVQRVMKGAPQARRRAACWMHCFKRLTGGQPLMESAADGVGICTVHLPCACPARVRA